MSSFIDIVLPFSLPLLRMQDKFTQLLNLLPDLKVMAQRGEDFLYFKHMQASIVVSKKLCLMGSKIYILKPQMVFK